MKYLLLKLLGLWNVNRNGNIHILHDFLECFVHRQIFGTLRHLVKSVAIDNLFIMKIQAFKDAPEIISVRWQRREMERKDSLWSFYGWIFLFLQWAVSPFGLYGNTPRKHLQNGAWVFRVLRCDLWLSVPVHAVSLWLSGWSSQFLTSSSGEKAMFLIDVASHLARELYKEEVEGEG